MLSMVASRSMMPRLPRINPPMPGPTTGKPRIAAASAGETDEEIARVTGYTVPLLRAVLRSGYYGCVDLRVDGG